MGAESEITVTPETFKGEKVLQVVMAWPSEDGCGSDDDMFFSLTEEDARKLLKALQTALK